MTEHRTLRESLGLSTGAEACLLGVNPRSVQKWDYGERDVPPPVWRLLRLLQMEQDGQPIRVFDVLTEMAALERVPNTAT